MKLMRYNNPWSMVEQMRDLLGSYGDSDSSSLATSTWAPAVDIHEDQHQFIIEADLPGVKKDDIEVYMEKGCLCIKGERKEEKKVEEGAFTRTERIQGGFCRKFMLPADTVNDDNINASFEDGVLKVQVPKAEVAKPKRIDIKNTKNKNITHQDSKENQVHQDSKENQVHQDEKEHKTYNL